jgi:hypothetical protein
MKNINGLQIIGVSYAERMAKKSVAETIQKIPGYDANGASVLLYHEPSQIEKIKKSGIKLSSADTPMAVKFSPMDTSHLSCIREWITDSIRTATTPSTLQAEPVLGVRR